MKGYSEDLEESRSDMNLRYLIVNITKMRMSFEPTLMFFQMFEVSSLARKKGCGAGNTISNQKVILTHKALNYN